MTGPIGPAVPLPPPAPAPAPPAHGIAPDNLAALPTAPGVYLFFGNGTETQLPLYIGKSINIRARVLSHIREPLEARMMRQVHRVDWVRTAGEVGALLLESQWIKTRHPLYNQRLRRSRELCAWQLAPDPANADAGRRPVPPRLVYSRDLDFATARGLHGLYASARAAQQALRDLAQTHRLCLQALGLEAPSARGCFGRQIGRCDGVCIGHEPVADHARRLHEALRDSQVQQWPFAGPVGLVERDGDWHQTHVVHHWRHLRTLDSRGAWPGATHGPADGPSAGFDLDAYRILMRPLMSGQGEVVALDAAAADPLPPRRPRRRRGSSSAEGPTS